MTRVECGTCHSNVTSVSVVHSVGCPHGYVPLADYRKLQKEFANALAALERVSQAVDQHDGMLDDFRRAVALAAPIVDAMCDLFRPDEEHPLDEPGPVLSTLKFKPSECLDHLTYGQLEVAAGALGFWERR